MGMAETTARNYGVWPQGYITGGAVTTTANTDLGETTGEPVTLYTAPDGGARVTRITVVARANCPAGVAHVYRQRSGESAIVLQRSKAFAADTVSATDAPALVDLGFTDAAPLRLAGGDKLLVGTSVALTAGFAWSLEGEKF